MNSSIVKKGEELDGPDGHSCAYSLIHPRFVLDTPPARSRLLLPHHRSARLTGDAAAAAAAAPLRRCHRAWFAAVLNARDDDDEGGSGGRRVSGLAAAHEAARGGGGVRVTLYEREDSLGGHARTVAVDGDAGPVDLDLGFMVFNRVRTIRILHMF